MERIKESWMKDNCTQCNKDITQGTDCEKYSGICLDCNFFNIMGYTWEEHLKRLEKKDTPEQKTEPIPEPPKGQASLGNFQ